MEELYTQLAMLAQRYGARRKAPLGAREVLRGFIFLLTLTTPFNLFIHTLH